MGGLTRIIGFLLGRALLILGCALSGAGHGLAQGAPDVSEMHLTFAPTFEQPLSWCSENCEGQTWRTKYFHSDGTPLARGVGQGTESEIFMDPEYLGLGINPFMIENETIALLVAPASERVQNAVKAAWPANHPKIAPRFTAGMLSTEKSFRQRYGYFEARIRVPNVPGTWPAFWLLGDPKTYDEIDVLELLCGRPTQQHLGHNWGVIKDGRKRSAGETLNGPDLSADFHTYGVLWTAQSIVYYRDATEVAHFSNPGLREPMYLILSMGTDGDWNNNKASSQNPMHLLRCWSSSSEFMLSIRK